VAYERLVEVMGCEGKERKRKGKERKGKERKGKERKGTEMRERSPSDTLVVRAFPTTVVSEERRLINSPVLLESKKEISCLEMVVNKSFLTLADKTQRRKGGIRGRDRKGGGGREEGRKEGRKEEETL